MADNGRIERSIDSDEPPSLVVVRAVAAASNRTMQDLDPLGETIDVEVMDTILQPGGWARVDFEYEGFEVTVDSETVVIDSSNHK